MPVQVTIIAGNDASSRLAVVVVGGSSCTFRRRGSCYKCRREGRSTATKTQDGLPKSILDSIRIPLFQLTVATDENVRCEHQQGRGASLT